MKAQKPLRVQRETVRRLQGAAEFAGRIALKVIPATIVVAVAGCITGQCSS
jgi:hypothetical protein